MELQVKTHNIYCYYTTMEPIDANALEIRIQKTILDIITTSYVVEPKSKHKLLIKIFHVIKTNKKLIISSEEDKKNFLELSQHLNKFITTIREKDNQYTKLVNKDQTKYYLEKAYKNALGNILSTSLHAYTRVSDLYNKCVVFDKKYKNLQEFIYDTIQKTIDNITETEKKQKIEYIIEKEKLIRIRRGMAANTFDVKADIDQIHMCYFTQDKLYYKELMLKAKENG